MNTSHICLACRRKLSHARLQRPGQWLSKTNQAHFISLSNPSPPTKGNAKSEPLGADGYMRKTRNVIPKPFPKRRNSPGDQLESLFEETLKSPIPANTKKSKTTHCPKTYQKAEQLKIMIRDSTVPAVDCWRFFLEHFGPEAWKKGLIDKASLPASLYILDGGYIGSLIPKMIKAKDDTPLSTELPSYTEISRTYLQFGILYGTDWTEMMFGLIRNILKHRKEPSPDPAVENTLISDLLGSWNLVFRHAGKTSDDFSSTVTDLDWSKAPTVSAGDIKHAYLKRGAQAAFAFLAPNMSIRHLDNMPLVAAATFTLLTVDPVANTGNPSSLISLLGKLLNHSSLKINQLSREGTRDIAPISEFVQMHWSQIKTQAAQLYESRSRHEGSGGQMTRNSNFTQKRLYDALKRQDVNTVDKIWSEVMNHPVSEYSRSEDLGTGNPSQGTQSAAIYDYLIMVYMALRRPNSAINVWNHMVNVGYPPTLATWNHMLLGCVQCRDAEAMEGIWARMKAANIQPDAVCWTTRIHGLVDCGKSEHSVKALDEMGRLWLVVARSKFGNKKAEDLQDVGDLEGAAKPTIANVNAAVAGLYKRQKLETAQRILAWADQFGIRADINTYNILLRPLVRSGQMGQALLLLQKMQQDGLQADVATFTIILEETLRHSDQHSAQEQQEIIANIFTEMEAAGVKPNQQTYNRIIHQLLLNDQTDLTAVNAVIARMDKQGLHPGPHVHTMLAQYYFSRSPPNIDAVRILIERARENTASVDHIFWSRIIEGYATVGDTASAIRILGRVSGPSMKISWITLEHLLTALVRNEEWDIARTMVRNVHQDSGGPIAPDARGQEGQHSFWKVAKQLGLLETDT